jgi:hypothetical protein
MYIYLALLCLDVIRDWSDFIDRSWSYVTMTISNSVSLFLLSIGIYIYSRVLKNKLIIPTSSALNTSMLQEESDIEGDSTSNAYMKSKNDRDACNTHIDSSITNNSSTPSKYNQETRQNLLNPNKNNDTHEYPDNYKLQYYIIYRINMICGICAMCFFIRVMCLAVVIYDSAVNKDYSYQVPKFVWFLLSNWIPTLCPVSLSLYIYISTY